MQRVLVTGANGFIGRRTIPLLLERSFEVIGMGRGTRPVGLDGRVRWFENDLRDHATTRKVLIDCAASHCINLAWYIEQGKYWRSPVNLDWVLASLNLIGAFKSAGGIRFVGAGSCAEYDWAHGWLSEAVTPCAPQTPFGRFKNSVFEASMAYAETAALSTAWARIFFLYGPGEAPTRLVPHVINSLLSGRFAPTSEGWQYRDFLHVDDVAAALVALLGSDVSGAVNIGSGVPVMVREVVGSIGKLLASPELLQFGAIPMRPGEPPLLVANTRRLREEVGWAPRYGLEDGLAATITWHKSQSA